MVGIKSFHQRLAELWTVNRRRELTAAEIAEIDVCLRQNAAYCYEMACLENLSLIASMTEDAIWQHEICADIDTLAADPHAVKTKKADQ